MSVVDTTRTPEHSRPFSTRNPAEKFIETLDDDEAQARDAFLQHLVVKQPYCPPRYSKKSTTNYTPSSVASIADRAPSTLYELKQQRLLAAADRKKRIIARIVSIVGLLIILLCAAIVTLTLKMAPKIDELVRIKAGAHQLVHIGSRMGPKTTVTMATLTTTHQENQTLSSVTTFGRILARTRRRLLIWSRTFSSLEFTMHALSDLICNSQLSILPRTTKKMSRQLLCGPYCPYSHSVLRGDGEVCTVQLESYLLVCPDRSLFTVLSIEKFDFSLSKGKTNKHVSSLHDTISGSMERSQLLCLLPTLERTYSQLTFR